MARRSFEDVRLTGFTEVALVLPEATRPIYGGHAQCLIRKSTFAYFLDDHHGDGIVALMCKVLPGDNKSLAETQPDRFYLPAYIEGPLAYHGESWLNSLTTIEMDDAPRDSQEAGVATLNRREFLKASGAASLSRLW